jgi:hypothetical protein
VLGTWAPLEQHQMSLFHPPASGWREPEDRGCLEGSGEQRCGYPREGRTSSLGAGSQWESLSRFCGPLSSGDQDPHPRASFLVLCGVPQFSFLPNFSAEFRDPGKS